MQNYVHEVKLLVAGEGGLVVEFGSDITVQTNFFVQQLTKELQTQSVPGILEIVPAYCSATIYFNPIEISRFKVSQIVQAVLNEIYPQVQEKSVAKVLHIPVCYGGVFGPDLELVARYTELTTQEVTGIHTSQPYLVYMLGFTPGFPYLGGLPEQLFVPRRENLRAKIPAGSVGIGGSQTGFYSMETTGEWWLIGRTPVKPFNLNAASPFLVSPGDYLQFYMIDIDEYFAIRRTAEAGNYIPATSFITREGESP
jgi:inhibitor of KinA